jgi:hypothetical protein
MLPETARGGRTVLIIDAIEDARAVLDWNEEIARALRHTVFYNLMRFLTDARVRYGTNAPISIPEYDSIRSQLAEFLRDEYGQRLRVRPPSTSSVARLEEAVGDLRTNVATLLHDTEQMTNMIVASDSEAREASRAQFDLIARLVFEAHREAYFQCRYLQGVCEGLLSLDPRNEDEETHYLVLRFDSEPMTPTQAGAWLQVLSGLVAIARAEAKPNSTASPAEEDEVYLERLEVGTVGTVLKVAEPVVKRVGEFFARGMDKRGGKLRDNQLATTGLLAVAEGLARLTELREQGKLSMQEEMIIRHQLMAENQLEVPTGRITVEIDSLVIGTAPAALPPPRQRALPPGSLTDEN